MRTVNAGNHILDLGYEGENNATQVVFDISDFELDADNNSDYQLCEWIKAENTNSYIDTGLYFENTDSEIELVLTTVTDEDYSDKDLIFKGAKTAPDLRFRYWNSQNEADLFWTQPSSSAITEAFSWQKSDDFHKLHVKFDSRGWVNIAFDKMYFRPMMTAYNFDAEQSSIIIGKNYKVKSFKHNGHLYLPAYRKSDGKIGLLNIENNTFIESTGNFIKGQDITYPSVKLFYKMPDDDISTEQETTYEGGKVYWILQTKDTKHGWGNVQLEMYGNNGAVQKTQVWATYCHPSLKKEREN